MVRESITMTIRIYDVHAKRIIIITDIGVNLRSVRPVYY